MIKRDNNKLLLLFSSVVTSGVNFLIFVVVPLYIGVDKLSTFTKDNYIGGIYLFGIAGSVSTIASLIINRYGIKALSYYIKLSVSSIIIIWILFYNLIHSYHAYICLIASIVLHINGFLLTNLILLGAARKVISIQIIQPAIFLLLILFNEMQYNSEWFFYYLISTLISLGFFLKATNFNMLGEILKRDENSFKMTQLLFPMLAGISFPLIFQFENILVGELTSLELGRFVVLQKLYSSVAISLFGSYIVYVISKESDCTTGVSKKLLFLTPLTSVIAVSVLVLCINYIIKIEPYDVTTNLLTILLSYLFSMAMFINFYMNLCNSKVNLLRIIVSSSGYFLIFIIFKPVTMSQVLLISICFYLLYNSMFLLKVFGEYNDNRLDC